MSLQTSEGHQEEIIDDFLSDTNSSSSVSLAEESSCSFLSDTIDIDDFLGPPTPVGCTHLLTYKLVGDNIDKNVRPRNMRSDH